jgi:hypothetical protein
MVVMLLGFLLLFVLVPFAIAGALWELTKV